MKADGLRRFKEGLGHRHAPDVPLREGAAARRVQAAGRRRRRPTSGYFPAYRRRLARVEPDDRQRSSRSSDCRVRSVRAGLRRAVPPQGLRGRERHAGAIVDRLAPHASTLLDVGCGTGPPPVTPARPIRRRRPRSQSGDARGRAHSMPGRAIPPGLTRRVQSRQALRRRHVPVRIDRVRDRRSRACVERSAVWPNIFNRAGCDRRAVGDARSIRQRPTGARHGGRSRSEGGAPVRDRAPRGRVDLRLDLPGWHADGVTSFPERQELGLFGDDVYRQAFADAGPRGRRCHGRSVRLRALCLPCRTRRLSGRDSVFRTSR